MKTDENAYPCSDLYLSCYLRAKYHLPIADLHRDPHSGRVTFVFEAEGLDIKAAIREFYNREATVNVREFCEEIGALKALIHNYGSA
jgi:hypothetical protein